MKVVSADDLSYPALLWWPNYLWVARSKQTLCVTTRHGHKEWLQSLGTRGDEILDSNGVLVKVKDWVKVAPFGGLSAIPQIILGSVFLELMISEARELDIEQAKRKSIRAIQSRLRFDGGNEQLSETIERIRVSNSHRQIIAAFPRTF